MNKMKQKQTAWVLLMTIILIKCGYPAIVSMATGSPELAGGMIILAVWYMMFEEITKRK